MISEEDRKMYIGGAGMNTKLLLESEAMHHDALSKENVLIFGAGVGVGTGILTGSRSVVTTKSPLTDLFGDSNIGGDFPIYMRKIGIDHLVFQDVSEKPVYVYIDTKQNITFYNAEDLYGTDTEKVTECLKEQHGNNIEVACIGTAGEKLCKFANIAMSKTHFAGRMGLGCVMGHKKLKAIVIEKKSRPSRVYDKEKLMEINKSWLKVTKTSVNFKMMSMQGTLLLIKQYSDTHTLPVENCQSNIDERTRNLEARVFQSRYETGKDPCRYCVMACEKKFEVKNGRFKGEKGSRLDYGSVASFGPAIGIFDYGEVIHLKLLGDRMGVDSMECSAVIALVFELQQRNLLPEKYANKELYQFGNIDGAEHLMNLMVSDDEFGKILAQGTYRASRLLNAEQYAFCIKKSSTGLHSNIRQAWTLGYLTSTRGGDHLKDFPFTSIFGGPSAEIMGKHIFNRDLKDKYHMPDEKGRIVWWHENYKYVIDSIGVCLFGMHGIVTQGKGYFDEMADVMNAILGTSVTQEDMFLAAERIYQLQNQFNIVSGLTKEDYQWPARRKEDSDNEEFLKATTILTRDDKGMLPEYFYFRGLTPDGKPTKQRYQDVGLEKFLDYAVDCPEEETGKMESVMKEVALSYKFTMGEKIKTRIIYFVVDRNVKKAMKKAKKAKMAQMKKMQAMGAGPGGPQGGPPR